VQFVCTECHNYEIKELSIFRTDSVVPKVILQLRRSLGTERKYFFWIPELILPCCRKEPENYLMDLLRYVIDCCMVLKEKVLVFSSQE